jgi:hypothetical protein
MILEAMPLLREMCTCARGHTCHTCHTWEEENSRAAQRQTLDYLEIKLMNLRQKLPVEAARLVAMDTTKPAFRDAIWRKRRRQQQQNWHRVCRMIEQLEVRLAGIEMESNNGD